MKTQSMFKNLITIILLCVPILSGCAQQNIKGYQGNWEGTLPHPESFNFDITIEELELNSYNLIISNNRALINRKLTTTNKNHIKIAIDEDVHFDLYLDADKKGFTGFINSEGLIYHTRLKRTEDNTFTGIWNPIMLDRLQSQSIFLIVQNNGNGILAAYPTFGDQRFTGTWAGDFSKKGDVIFFRDYKTGLKFKATLLLDKIQLDILLADVIITTTDLVRSETDWEFATDNIDRTQNINTPPQLNDGWITTNINNFDIDPAQLVRMIDDVNTNRLIGVNSVLIAKGDKLVFENYFNGGNANIPHDQRSGSKSISSAMIGIAIDDKIIESTEEKLYDFIPERYQYTKDSLKSKIDIKDLLTMASGIDVSRNSTASEGVYQDLDDNNWLELVLKAPMVDEAGTHANYGSASPFLLGVCLNNRLDRPLELYMDQKLFSPLSITNYILQTDDTGSIPYFAGGLYLTPRDMLKFGQLYLNKGKWRNKRVISENWVKESFKKHTQLENVRDKNEYGFLWWHKTYFIGNKEIESIEARGAGGQYIFVIPELKSVVVITSGNFRNGELLQQPEKILEEYILPAIMK